MVEASEYIKFVVELHHGQEKNGRWFLHGQPQGTGSWDLEEIQKLEIECNVQLVVVDQCMYGSGTSQEKGRSS